ncbi:MAG: hypothetical protein ACFN40_06465 [Bacteroidota bacterium]
MTTRAKTTLSSLYETGDSPCGRTSEWVGCLSKSLVKSIFRHIQTIITM